MPISYSSVNEEHIHVRNKVGIFDVSHMGEFEISGLNSLEFVQYYVLMIFQKLMLVKHNIIV